MSDGEFHDVVKSVDLFFSNFKENMAARVIVNQLPSWIVNRVSFYNFTKWVFPSTHRYFCSVYDKRGLFDIIFKHINDHKQTIDRENPRDFLGQ